MKIIQITDDLIGKEISCFIDDNEIKSARIQKGLGNHRDGEEYFICQNVRNGGWEEIDMLGYDYGWCINNGTPMELKNNGVSNIQLINNENNYEIY